MNYHVTNTDNPVDFPPVSEPADGRATVEIELDDHEWYELMKLAHHRDITLNQLVEQILREFIQEHHNGTLPKPTV
jgi:predicted DNA-binding ribbon-helix-helix protein